MLFDRFETLGLTLPEGAPFDTLRSALTRYLDPESVEGRRLRTRPLGASERITLCGDDLFALENVYLTKSEEECPLESHDVYVDLQAMVEGCEFLDVTPTDSLEIETPLDPQRDIIFYRKHAPLTRLRLEAGYAALLLPGDAHRPGVSAGVSPTIVRKVVFKIKNTLLKNTK